MTTGLVGSEMCIRDSTHTETHTETHTQRHRHRHTHTHTHTHTHFKFSLYGTGNILSGLNIFFFIQHLLHCLRPNDINAPRVYVSVVVDA